MKCGNCNSELPPGTAICPTCGTVTSYYTSGLASAPYNASQPSSPTFYGSQPYEGSPQQNPYGSPPSSPYDAPLQAPPPPPPPLYITPSQFPSPPPSSQGHRGPRMGIIIGVALLVLVLIAAGLFALLSHSGSTTHTSVQSSPAVAISPAATSNAVQNPYPPNTGTLVLNDPMHDNSKGYKWDEATITNAGTCGFIGNGYHIHVSQKGLICVPEASSLVFSNLAFEVKLTITQGDQAAVVLRLNQANVAGYYFFIDTQGGYSLCRDSCSQKSLGSGSNNAINKGQNQPNLVALVANGSTISAYVNNQFITSATDTADTQGQIGIESYSSSGAGDVLASDARVWKL